MFDLIIQLDYWLLSHINGQWTSTWADWFFVTLTDLNKTPFFKFVLVPLVIGGFLYRFKRKGISLFLLLLLALGFSDWSGARVKHYYERMRPFENPAVTVLQKSDAGHFSFYSNHSSNMMTFAIYTGFFFAAWRIPLIALALLVGYSRVYTGVHYPSDVCGGLLMGFVWGFLFSRFAKRVHFGNESSSEITLRTSSQEISK